MRTKNRTGFTNRHRTTARLIGELLMECDSFDEDSARYDILRDVKRLLFGNDKSVKVADGMFRACIVTRDCVFKVSRDAYRDDQLVEEFDFIKKMSRSNKVKKHFPYTEIVSGNSRNGPFVVQLQETIPMPKTRGKYQRDAVRIGSRLGITDIHYNNFGMKDNTVVFIDVDCRKSSDSTESSLDSSTSGFLSKTSSWLNTGPCSCTACKKKRGEM